MASNVDLELEGRFKLASTYVQSVAGNLDSKLLLQLYGLYKQATVGKCNTAQPSWFNVTAKQKWEAWKLHGDMTAGEAMQRYIDVVTRVGPEWEDEAKDMPTGWVSVSCPLVEPEEHILDAEKTLIDWVKEGRIDKLEDHADLNHRDEMGMTSLHWAADRGNSDIVQRLLELGADVNSTDSEGQTALHYAASCGHERVIQVLLSFGANPNVEDGEGAKPVDVACSPDIAELLTRQ